MEGTGGATVVECGIGKVSVSVGDTTGAQEIAWYERMETESLRLNGLSMLKSIVGMRWRFNYHVHQKNNQFSRFGIW